MKRLLASAMITGLLASAASAADLTICVEGAYAPFSETAADGSIVGFDIDIANALCAEMGKTCEMAKTDWDGIIPALLEKKCDAIVASMSITEDRKQVIDFTARYYQTPAKFAAKAGVDWVDTNDGLAGKTVGVQRGTIHQAYLEGEYPDVELQLYASQDEAYLDLVAGRIDAVMADSIAVDDGFLKTEGGAGFAFFGGDHAVVKYHGEGAGIGVRKEDTELRDALSAAIDKIRASGTYQKINAKYFSFDIYGG